VAMAPIRLRDDGPAQEPDHCADRHVHEHHPTPRHGLGEEPTGDQARRDLTDAILNNSYVFAFHLRKVVLNTSETDGVRHQERSELVNTKPPVPL
jgi:hypothetical protein